MIHELNIVISVLREELQQYGEMLARLDEQQQSIVQRNPDAVLASAVQIEDQSKVLAECRKARLSAFSAYLSRVPLPKGTSVEESLTHAPSEYKPLLQALVEENNQLITRIQQRSRQNRLLLMRSIETIEKLIHTLTPHKTPECYNHRGRAESGNKAQILYAAVA